MEMTGKATTQFVKKAWSVSVTALYTGKATPHFVKRAWCFNYSWCTIFVPFVRIFTEYLKWRWQEKQHLNFVKRAWSVSDYSFMYDILYIINYQEKLHRNGVKCFDNSFIYCCISSIVRIFTEMEMTGKANSICQKRHEVFQQLYTTIVVYHQLSGSHRVFFGMGDDRKSDTL